MINDILPKITIVTPVLNRVNFIEETILSVLSQNYPNLEYIIIDGGSTDGTFEIIKKYSPNITCLISEPDKGMYDAIQKGFDKSTGDIMTWLNSDDKFQQGALGIVSEIFSNLPDIEWITGTPALYNHTGQCVKVSTVPKWSKSRFWIGDYKWIQQENVFWKRSLWEKAGGFLDLNYKFAADFELWCRYFQFASLYSVNTVLGGFRIHGQQLSLEFSNLYESEAKNIILNVVPLQNELKKFYKLKKLNSLKNSLNKLNFSLSKFLVLGLNMWINHSHNFPNQIYYDFKSKRWIK